MTASPPNLPQRAHGLCRNRTAGFTLTEVVIALGIMIFVVGTVVAVLPYALQTHNESNASTVVAAIVTDLSRELEQMPFKSAELNKSLARYETGEVFYFDHEGFRQDEFIEGKTVFQICVEVADVDMRTTQGGNAQSINAFLKRGGGDVEEQSVLKVAKLHVMPKPVPDMAVEDFTDPETRDRSIETYHIIINDKGGVE